MLAHLTKQLVLVITECVPSVAGQNTIIEAIKRQAIITAKRGGEAAAIAYLKDELSGWKVELEAFRKKKRQELRAQRMSTTLNFFMALLAVIPTATDLLIYFGYLAT